MGTCLIQGKPSSENRPVKTAVALTLTNNIIPQCPSTDRPEPQNIFIDTT